MGEVNPRRPAGCDRRTDALAGHSREVDPCHREAVFVGDQPCLATRWRRPRDSLRRELGHWDVRKLPVASDRKWPVRDPFRSDPSGRW